MNLGERYKELRTSVKDESGNPISIKDFAAKCVKLQAPRISELENNKREMSLTELKAYHEYFKVSFEYLMGETDVKTVDEDIQAACKVTGLSEKAVNKIIDFQKYPNTFQILVYFLETSGTYETFKMIRRVCQLKEKLYTESEKVCDCDLVKEDFAKMEQARDYLKNTIYDVVLSSDKAFLFNHRVIESFGGVVHSYYKSQGMPIDLEEEDFEDGEHNPTP